jgi:hypothetical protein
MHHAWYAVSSLIKTIYIKMQELYAIISENFADILAKTLKVIELEQAE